MDKETFVPRIEKEHYVNSKTTKIVEMDKHHLINAFKRAIYLQKFTSERGVVILEEVVKTLEKEIINRLKLIKK